DEPAFDQLGGDPVLDLAGVPRQAPFGRLAGSRKVGASPSAVEASDHQNVPPKAGAAPTRPPGCTAKRWVRSGASTPVPKAPPTYWTIRVAILAWDRSSCCNPWRAALNIAMFVIDRPAPRTTSAPPSSNSLVVVPASA